MSAKKGKKSSAGEVDSKGRTAKDRQRIVAELQFKGYKQLADDNDPELVKIRGQYESQFIEAAAERLHLVAHLRAVSKRPRSTRQSPIRVKILEVMREARKAWTFDQFLARWLDTSNDELMIAKEGDRYIVEDTNVGGEAKYTRAALRNLWTKANPKSIHR